MAFYSSITEIDIASGRDETLSCVDEENTAHVAKVVEKKVNKKKCAAEGCSYDGRDRVLHGFPAIVVNAQIDSQKLEKCRQWVQLSGNSRLLDEYSTNLHGRFGLCSNHFSTSQYYNKTRKRLLPNAIPTLNLSAALSQSDMGVFPKWGPGDMFLDLSNIKDDAANGSENIFIDPSDKGHLNSTNVAENILEDNSNANIKDDAANSSENIFIDPNDKGHLNSTNVAENILEDNSNATVFPECCLGEVVIDSSNIEDFAARNLNSENVAQNILQNKFNVNCDQQFSQPEQIPPNSEPAMESLVSDRKQNKKLCAAKDCCYDGSDKIIHTFPAIIVNGQINRRNLEKCKQWLQYSGNPRLLDEYSSKLHGRFGLCSNHFTTCQYYNKFRKRLLPNAIPTLNLSAALSQSDMDVFPKWGPEEIFIDLCNTEYEAANGSDNINPDQQSNVNPDQQPPRPDALQLKFETAMDTLEWRTCQTCKEKFFTRKESKRKCVHSKPICLSLSDENGFDPGPVPLELQNLTSIEEQLISRVHPVIQVYKVKGHQFCYSGNIINFPQDVKSFATKLPHDINQLKSTIKIRTEKNADDKHKDFDVRADVVRKALVWLQKNNPHYYDIQISEENMALLPEDGNVYDRIQTIDSEEENETDSNNTDGFVTESNVPMFSIPNEQDQIENVINWPTIERNAVDEFKSGEEYIVKAFPTLFPRGTCDISNARNKKISDSTYFQHLIRYHDGRFAKHNRFRFFALNSLMRWNAINDGNIFVKRHPDLKNLTVRELRERVEQDPTLMKKIMFQGNNIRGTKAFWHARGLELEAMIQQMGLPTLFITLSAADMHWPELYKLLAPEEATETMTDYRRRQLIQENPLIVDEFFLTRSETFLQEVLTPKYKIKDHWFRIEYQHRGSPHLHGLVWLEDAPDVTNISNASEEDKEKILNYFDNIISTMHPNVNEEPASIHPCRIRLSEVEDMDKDLAQLLNRVQRHTVCTPGYCLKGNPPKCRFKFPIQMQETTFMDYSDTKNIQLITKRNDSRLNKFNTYIIQTWRGNIDVSPVLSEKALINYLAKYVSKSEVRSETLIDIMKTVIADSDQDKPAVHALRKMFIKTCSERDFSAQETMHILMGLKLYSRGGRNIVHINFNDSSQWQKIRKDPVQETLSFIDKYKRRNKSQENTCMWNMAKFQKVTNPNKFNIVMVYPKLKFNPNSENNEQFFRQQCLLFVPWSDEEKLQDAKSWEEVYNEHLSLISQNRSVTIDLSGQPDEDAVYNEYEPEVLSREQWMAVSRMGSNQHLDDVMPGLREVDLNKNWHESLAKYHEMGGIPFLQCFLANAKKDSQTDIAVASDQSHIQLTPEQSKVIELAQLQIWKINNMLPLNIDGTKLPKKVIVQGKAGTGKSVIVSELVRLVEANFGKGSIIVVGPTGVSAVNVNGSTIHNKLKLGIRRKGAADEFAPLKGQAAHDLQIAFENVKFVIADEFSMIGCNMLSKIDKRLRQAKQNPNEDFGGLHIYLFGDVKQLAPVGDCAAYSVPQNNLETIRGKELYENFDAAFVLSKIHRQSDFAFLQVLNNISEGNVTLKDYDILKTRFTTSVTYEEFSKFHNALHLFPQVKQVQQHNKDFLLTNKNELTGAPEPIVCVNAKHNCEAAKHGSINDAEGLDPVLFLSEKAKVMLRVNLWTEHGLVNGAMGQIEDIVFAEGAHPSHDPPAVVICKFPSYKGPYLDQEKKTVPIIPLIKSWVNDNGVTCSREQFPLQLSYATTIHKSQGLTLEMAFVDIGPKEDSPGKTYVALSRVKALQKVLLEPFPFKRLQSFSTSKALQRRLEWENKLRQKLVSQTLCF